MLAKDKLKDQLNDRERLILRHIVYNYILTADPLGSRSLSKKYNVGLSPATIRNTMADLENLGLLTHTHTSAGRMPTDLGYRLYVDDLMKVEVLSEKIRKKMSERVDSISIEVHDVMDKVGEMLSEVTKLLSVISAPDVSVGILEKVELIKVGADRIMIIIVVQSGAVRTINLEMQSSITKGELSDARSFINQRLSGLRLSEIPRKIKDRLSGNKLNRNTIIRLFLDFPDQIFSTKGKTETLVGGARHVLEQPEYQSPESFKGIIELIEDHDVIVHLLKDRKSGVRVTIGEEHTVERLKDLSVITSRYRIGEHFGSLGIIGPTRMNYSWLISLVDYTSRLVSERVVSEDHKEKNEKKK